MAFTPDKPKKPTDLYVLIDNEYDEVYTIVYSSDEGLFFRYDGEWQEWNEAINADTDDTEVVYVNPDFIPVFDEAESEDLAIGAADVKQYEAKVS